MKPHKKTPQTRGQTTFSVTPQPFDRSSSVMQEKARHPPSASAAYQNMPPYHGQWVVPLHCSFYTMKNFITEPQSSDTVSQRAQIKTCLRCSEMCNVKNTYKFIKPVFLQMLLSKMLYFSRNCFLFWFFVLSVHQKAACKSIVFFLAAFCQQTSLVLKMLTPEQSCNLSI